MYRFVAILISSAWCLLGPASSTSAQQPGEISYHDESAMPAGEPGERIRSLIETVNSGDPERVRRFIEEAVTERFRNFVPMDHHVEAFLSVARQWGGVEFHSIRTYVPARPDETVVILKDRNFDSWRAFTLRFDESDDHRIAGLGFNDARRPSNVEAPPALSEAEAVREIGRAVERVCERDAFSGAVLVARGEDVLYRHACGEASKRFQVANNIDTKFNLGSMNKMFTATAVAQMAEQGALSYDDPIGKYVDESWLPRAITDRVTIHHLLTHTSGLGSYFNDTFWESSRERFRDVDDYKPLVRGDTLAFEPGARFRYSNTGMLLLGVVIESVTGESYFDHIREHVYEPAGMTSSDSYEMDRPVANLAIGYEPDWRSEYGWRNNLYRHVLKGGPAGGGFSTVGDLHRFARALVTGKLVSPATLERMWTDHSGAGYGYGFGLNDGALGRSAGHTGGFDGISASLEIFPDTGFVVAVLSNYGGVAPALASKVRSLLERTVSE